MRWEDLPPSVNVEDRRGEIPAAMLAEMMRQKRIPIDLSPPAPPNELSEKLGLRDIGAA